MLEGQARLIFYTWAARKDFRHQNLRSVANKDGCLFLLDGDIDNPENVSMSCSVCLATLEPFQSRDLITHYKKHLVVLDSGAFNATLVRRKPTSQAALRLLANETFAACVADSENTAQSCMPFLKMLSIVVPYLGDITPELGNSIMEQYIPSVCTKRQEQALLFLVGQHTGIAIDATGDRSQKDKTQNKLRAMTIAVPCGPATTYSILAVLDSVPSSEGTAVANAAWLTQSLSNLYQHDLEVQQASLDWVASDWGSDNTGKECRKKFLGIRESLLWFRCVEHMIDLPGKEMKEASPLIVQLYTATNNMHSVASSFLPTELQALMFEMLENDQCPPEERKRNLPPMVSSVDGSPILKESGPPFVNATRWLPFWEWLNWMHKHFLVFWYFVEKRLPAGIDHGTHAATLTALFRDRPMELFCAIRSMCLISVPLQKALVQLQSRKPHVEQVAPIIDDIAFSLCIDELDVRELYDEGIALIGGIADQYENSYMLLECGDDWDPTPDIRKSWARFFTTFVLEAARDKLSDVWDNYPEQEKRFLKFAPHLSHLSRDQKPEFEILQAAIPWKWQWDNGKIRPIDWESVRKEWKVYQIDERWADRKYEKYTPLEFWMTVQHGLAQLALVAIRALRVIPNSCDPERGFSVFKRVVVNQKLRWKMGQDKKMALTKSTYNKGAGPPICADWPLSEFKEKFGVRTALPTE